MREDPAGCKGPGRGSEGGGAMAGRGGAGGQRGRGRGAAGAAAPRGRRPGEACAGDVGVDDPRALWRYLLYL